MTLNFSNIYPPPWLIFSVTTSFLGPGCGAGTFSSRARDKTPKRVRPYPSHEWLTGGHEGLTPSLIPPGHRISCRHPPYLSSTQGRIGYCQRTPATCYRVLYTRSSACQAKISPCAQVFYTAQTAPEAHLAPLLGHGYTVAHAFKA